jgi:predicted ribosomally synthesized peptide with nif11-like leader
VPPVRVRVTIGRQEASPVSVQSAFKFIQRLRGDQDLRDKFTALGPDGGLEPLLQLAREAGFEFSEDELRQAFKHDWAMRRLRRSAASEAHGQAAEPPQL